MGTWSGYVRTEGQTGGSVSQRICPLALPPTRPAVVLKETGSSEAKGPVYVCLKIMHSHSPEMKIEAGMFTL